MAIKKWIDEIKTDESDQKSEAPPEQTGAALESFPGEKRAAAFLDSAIDLIKNGGGLYTTDWINPTSQGIAQYWADTLNVYCFTSHPAATEATFSIVQGNGFTGNAQRIAKIGSVISSNHANCIGIYNNFYQLDSSKSYDLSFKYRSNTTVFINNQYTINSNPATAISVILTGISFTDLYLYF